MTCPLAKEAVEVIIQIIENANCPVLLLRLLIPRCRTPSSDNQLLSVRKLVQAKAQFPVMRIESAKEALKQAIQIVNVVLPIHRVGPLCILFGAATKLETCDSSRRKYSSQDIVHNCELA